MIHGIHFKSLDKHDNDSFTFTFTYESHGESRDFTVKVLSDKLIHRKNRSQVYVRLNCDDDKSNPDPDKCHIEIGNKDDDTTPQKLNIDLWVKNFSLELYERFVQRRKSTEAMIQIQLPEKEEKVWQELNRKRDDKRKKVEPLLTKEHFTSMDVQILENFVKNLTQDRYNGDMYDEFNTKWNEKSEEEKEKNKANKELQRKRYEQKKEKSKAHKEWKRKRYEQRRRGILIDEPTDDDYYKQQREDEMRALADLADNNS